MVNKHRTQVRVRDAATGTLIEAGSTWVTVTDAGLDIAVETLTIGRYEILLSSSPASRIEALTAVENDLAKRRHAKSREIPDTAAGQ